VIWRGSAQALSQSIDRLHAAFDAQAFSSSQHVLSRLAWHVAGSAPLFHTSGIPQIDPGADDEPTLAVVEPLHAARSAITATMAAADRDFILFPFVAVRGRSNHTL
jgi:hypothetical protein